MICPDHIKTDNIFYIRGLPERLVTIMSSSGYNLIFSNGEEVVAEYEVTDEFVKSVPHLSLIVDSGMSESKSKVFNIELKGLTRETCDEYMELKRIVGKEVRVNKERFYSKKFIWDPLVESLAEYLDDTDILEGDYFSDFFGICFYSYIPDDHKSHSQNPECIGYVSFPSGFITYSSIRKRVTDHLEDEYTRCVINGEAGHVYPDYVSVLDAAEEIITVRLNGQFCLGAHEGFKAPTFTFSKEYDLTKVDSSSIQNILPGTLSRLFDCYLRGIATEHVMASPMRMMYIFSRGGFLSEVIWEEPSLREYVCKFFNVFHEESPIMKLNTLGELESYSKNKADSKDNGKYDIRLARDIDHKYIEKMEMVKKNYRNLTRYLEDLTNGCTIRSEYTQHYPTRKTRGDEWRVVYRNAVEYVRRRIRDTFENYKLYLQAPREYHYKILEERERRIDRNY